MRAPRLTLLAVLALAHPALGADNGFDDFLSKPASFADTTSTAPSRAAPKVKVAAAPQKAAPKAEAKAAAKPAPKAAPAVNPTEVQNAALADLNARLGALEKPAPKPAAYALEGLIDLRYDHQSDVALAYGAPGSSAARVSLGETLGVPGSTASRGAINTVYARRAELKLSDQAWPGVLMVLGWDLSENKLKDVGLQWEPLHGLKLFMGQARLRFGIEPQTSSSKTPFAERAMVYGGSHPFSGGPSALVKERGMGAHGGYALKAGPLGLDLGLSVVNSATEDQAAGQNKPNATGAFPASIADQGPSLSARGGLSLSLPWIDRFAVGASYLRDPQNSRPAPSDPSQERLEEVWGLDAALELPAGIKLWGEWLASQRLEGGGGAPNGVWLGVDRRREGWYAVISAELLRPWMGPGAPSIELLARREAFMTVSPDPVFPSRDGASSLGLRWNQKKSWHLALNYSVYDVDDDAGAMAGSELLLLQQQLAF